MHNKKKEKKKIIIIIAHVTHPMYIKQMNEKNNRTMHKMSSDLPMN